MGSDDLNEDIHLSNESQNFDELSCKNDDLPSPIGSSTCLSVHDDSDEEVTFRSYKASDSHLNENIKSIYKSFSLTQSGFQVMPKLFEQSSLKSNDLVRYQIFT